MSRASRLTCPVARSVQRARTGDYRPTHPRTAPQSCKSRSPRSSTTSGSNAGASACGTRRRPGTSGPSRRCARSFFRSARHSASPTPNDHRGERSLTRRRPAPSQHAAEGSSPPMWPNTLVSAKDGKTYNVPFDVACQERDATKCALQYSDPISLVRAAAARFLLRASVRAVAESEPNRHSCRARLAPTPNAPPPPPSPRRRTGARSSTR